MKYFKIENEKYILSIGCSKELSSDKMIEISREEYDLLDKLIYQERPSSGTGCYWCLKKDTLEYVLDYDPEHII